MYIKKTVKKLLIICGSLLIFSAVGLCIYNLHENNTAFQHSQEVLTDLKKAIADNEDKKPKDEKTQESSEVFTNPADDLYAEYEEEENDNTSPLPTVEIDGSCYCGIITLPSLGLELPVTDGWSYEALKYSPCRYSGNTEENNMIIAAHNYSSHFGRIESLNIGDEIIFTDINGVQHRYITDNIQYVDGYDIDGMFSGQADDWDITLFTCTLSGKSRVTIRGTADSFVESAQ